MQGLGRGFLDDGQAFAEAVGLAGEHGAFGQHIGLATEAANALDTTDEAGLDDGLGLGHFGVGRTILDQAGHFFTDGGFNFCGIGAGFDIRLHDE